MAKISALATALGLAAIAAAGIVDAVRDDRAGPAVLFAILLIGVVVQAQWRTSRAAVPLRRDLASWLERTSPATGESPESMANRAVSRLRAAFIDSAEHPQ